MPEESYIRGAAATGVDARKVGRVLAYLAVIALAGSAIVLAVLSASNDSNSTRLREHGVHVQVTVTSCIGISSGVGMGVEFYDCSGRYSLGGSDFVEVIHGSRANLAPGTVFDALAVPGDPASLALPSSSHSSSTATWVAAIVMGAAAVAGGATLAVVRRRRPGTPQPSGAGPAPT